MITLAQPSMALNAEGVPGPDYHMWNTWRVPAATPPSHLLGWTTKVAQEAAKKNPGGLKAIVLNAHGGAAWIGLGTGIGNPEIPLFSSLSGLVQDIYIVACSVATFTGPGDGNLFCGAIAKASGANVYASDSKQTTGLWPHFPFGKIDGYEGKVWKWKPDGSNELTDL